MYWEKEKCVIQTAEQNKKKIIGQGQLSNANLVEIVYVENIHSVYA